MLNILKNWWKNLRVRNQILIFQCSLIVIFFVISYILCMVLIDKFQLFITQELLEFTIIKSIISTINILIVEINQIGKIELYQSILYTRSLANLYKFQYNKVKTVQDNELCLQIPHQKAFYSYQFCSGIYGNLTNETKLDEIRTFISLQNQIIPLNQLYFIKEAYNIYLDEQLFVSQYKGEFQLELKQDLKEAIQTIKSQKLKNYKKSVSGNSGQMVIQLSSIPGTQIVYGFLKDLSVLQIIKANKQISFLKQRNMVMLLSGLIISDTQNSSQKIKYFQNSSVTGFNQYQFEMMCNFTQRKIRVINECEPTMQDKYLCLIDQNKQKKLLFPMYIEAEGIPQIIVVIVDAIYLDIIRNQFDEQLLNFVGKQFKIIASLISFSFLCCLLVQVILFMKLNKPLKQLLDQANYHIHQNQFRILRYMNLSKKQDIINRLIDSFCNLIYFNKNNEINQSFTSELEQIQWVLQNREIRKIIKMIRKHSRLVL